MVEGKTRKKRYDNRTHLIYQITCSVTQEIYIGMTVAVGKAHRNTLKLRLQRHVSRAVRENKNWALCCAIRLHGREAFKIKLIDRVLGKAAAHKLEIEYIKDLRPSLNSTHC